MNTKASQLEPTNTCQIQHYVKLNPIRCTFTLSRRWSQSGFGGIVIDISCGPGELQRWSNLGMPVERWHSLYAWKPDRVLCVTLPSAVALCHAAHTASFQPHYVV